MRRQPMLTGILVLRLRPQCTFLAVPVLVGAGNIRAFSLLLTYSTSIYIEEREATSTFGVPFQSVRYALSTRGDFRKPAFCNIVISL